MLASGSTQISLMPDWTFFIQLVVFFCAFLILNFLVFKPLLKLYQIRKKYTVDAEAHAKSKNEEAVRLELEVKQKLSEAILALQKEREKKIAETMYRAEEVTSQAKKQSKDISKSARESASSEKDKAAGKIKDELRGLVDEIKSKVVS